MSKELDFSQKWTQQDLLHQIRGLHNSDIQLLKRDFIELCSFQNGTNAEGNPVSQADIVTVMQWNMLAQGLSTGKDNFVRCPTKALAWDGRRWKIIEEILKVNPDVLCLQEVDHYDFLSQTLKSVGFSGCFMPKPDSPALYTPESNGPDGCAMFYKEKKYDLVDQQSHVLQSSNVDTNQVCILSKFKLKESGAVFSVGTTHLKAKHGWDELRRSQGLDLLKKVKSFVNGGPVVICGDFNAPPSEAVVTEFKESDLNLKNAYELKKDIPQYTTWKIRGGQEETEYCRIIDYMWHSGNHIEVKSLLSIPYDEEIGKDRLPSFAYPSDHFSLAIKMSIL